MMHEPASRILPERSSAMRSVPLALLLVLAAAAPVAAGSLEIPLGTLPGSYPGTQAERTEVFVFGGDPAEIQAARVHIRGSETPGAVLCGGGPDPVPYPMQIAAFMLDETTGRWWTATKEIDETGGEFDALLALSGWGGKPPTWDFLADGKGTLFLLAGPVDLVGICGPVTAKPSAEIAGVSLLFDLSAPAVLEGSTWGAVKAVYR